MMLLVLGRVLLVRMKLTIRRRQDCGSFQKDEEEEECWRGDTLTMELAAVLSGRTRTGSRSVRPVP